MQPIFFISLFICIVCCSSIHKRDYTQRHYYTLHSTINDNEISIKRLCTLLNTDYEGKVGELPDYYWMSTDSASATVDVLHQWNIMKSLPATHHTSWIETIDRIDRQLPTEYLHRRALSIDDIPIIENIPEEQRINNISLEGTDDFNLIKGELGITDPGFDNQWYLLNRMEPGNDLNITGVWGQGITGRGVTVAVVDDGLDRTHADLKDNYVASNSYDFVTHSDNPRPISLDDSHGTRSAGIIAAAKNDICGIGVAYDSNIAGIRISGNITEADKAAALNHKYQSTEIYACSWTAPDGGDDIYSPSSIVLDALKNGVEKGRKEAGSIYVFGTGDGGSADNCNYNGYANSPYTITVGTIDREGKLPFYAERCSAQLIVTYSSGGDQYLYTADIGDNQCTDRHGGTAGAASLASGVFALVLSVRPDLTWRDMQYLCVQSAVPFSLDDEDWDNLPSGRMYNHKFGYGALNAYRIVELAKVFKSVREQTMLTIMSEPLDSIIPDLTSSNKKQIAEKEDAFHHALTITTDRIRQSRLGRLEHVTVTVNIDHEHRGDLEILLMSPNGIISQLANPRPADKDSSGLNGWTFMTVKHWEEDPMGNWTLYVIDATQPEYTGVLFNWTLTLWGELDTSTAIAFIPKNGTSSHSFLIYGILLLFMCISVMSTAFIIKRYMLHSPEMVSYQRTEEDDSYEFDSLLNVSMDDSEEEEDRH
ncbi:peptidase S8/S53 domain-containing protein [Pilobolus umbonatus]|nr:peptidase S8/S53 domain-containing protein [Pilobolus umbonatus]